MWGSAVLWSGRPIVPLESSLFAAGSVTFPVFQSSSFLVENISSEKARQHSADRLMEFAPLSPRRAGSFRLNCGPGFRGGAACTKVTTVRGVFVPQPRRYGGASEAAPTRKPAYKLESHATFRVHVAFMNPPTRRARLVQPVKPSREMV